MPDIRQNCQIHVARPLLFIKQNVRFQVGICLEKCQLDQIENDRLEAIIFNMGDIGKTVSDS